MPCSLEHLPRSVWSMYRGSWLPVRCWSRCFCLKPLAHWDWRPRPCANSFQHIPTSHIPTLEISNTSSSLPVQSQSLQRRRGRGGCSTCPKPKMLNPNTNLQHPTPKSHRKPIQPPQATIISKRQTPAEVATCLVRFLDPARSSGANHRSPIEGNQ